MARPGPTDPGHARGEVSLHGVFLALRLPDRGGENAPRTSTGVLIVGEPGIGKSELALDLVSRGHALIADDSPLFRRQDDGSWMGHCPFPLQDFLEVRGLGILDLRRLFGDEAIIQQHRLDLVIRLEDAPNASLSPEERLRGAWREYREAGLVIPALPLSVRGGRNLALLVETAARVHACGSGEGSGYNAVDELSRRLESSISNAQRNPVREAREVRDQDAQNLGKESP